MDLGLSNVAWSSLERMIMGNIVWTIIVILFVIWLIGLLGHIGGALINLLLVVVVIGVIYNLMTGRKAV